jgi:hypothetical protein
MSNGARSKTVLALILFIVCVAKVAFAIELRRTGQIECYESASPFGEIACVGSGLDGDVRAGTPIPDLHFSDNLDGTLTDNATGLVWLQDIDCISDRTWGEALADAASLADGQCDLTDESLAGDWRMPNVVELESLYNGEVSNLRAYLLSVGFTGDPLVSGNARYWSSTTNVGRGQLAYTLGGHSYAGSYGFAVAMKSVLGYVAAVRGASARLRKSGQTTCYETGTSYAEIPCAGTGQDGEHQAGVTWPVPRFTDKGDGTVVDNLTGLVWLKNADCFGNQDSDAALVAASALAEGQCALSDGSTAGQWRVPNRTELFSLVDYGADWPKFPAGHPFVNLPTGYQVGPWTSTLYPNPQWSWYILFGDTCCDGSGNITAAARQGHPFPSQVPVWPVRGGAVSSFHPDITVIDDVAPANDLDITFGDQSANSVRERTVTLRNDGGAALTISTIAANDPLAAPFSIVGDDCSNRILEKEASCSIIVRCEPVSTSTFGDTFDIPSDDSVNSVVFFSVNAHAVLCGDVNDDGRIAATDALAILRTAVGSSDCGGLDSCICNVDGSGDVTATDALMTLKYAVGIGLTLDCSC